MEGMIGMKTIVLYSSYTGKTKGIAEAVAQGIGVDTPCVSLDAIPADIDTYECVFFGCYIESGFIDAKSQEILKTIHNKKVAIFVTMWIGPYSDDIAKRLRRIVEFLPQGCQIVGTYITPVDDAAGDQQEREHRLAADFAANTMHRLMSAQ